MATTDLLENRNDVDDAEQSLPILQPWVVLSDLGGNQYVVKDSRTHFYFEAGPEEFFILQSLTHEVTLSELHQAYRERFGQAVEQGDLDDFLGMLSRRGLIAKANELSTGSSAAPVVPEPTDVFDDDPNEEAAGPKRRWGSGSIFYYRVPLVNPDRLLTFVASTVPWVWTKGFLIASLGAMVVALLVMMSNRNELIASFNASLRWDTLILVWVTTLFVTALHELAHGATCKKFGGEVRESGLLFLMLMPCLYVNVSDAWLIRERYKRLLITAAGGYMDLCLWCLAVFAWRITLPGTLINHLSFVVLSTCGARGLINFNPLLRLDGYYLLSDYLRIPNLYAQGRNHWMKHLAWVLWGGPRPESLPNGKLLFCYGLISWIFALIFMNVVLINIFSYISLEFGLAGLLFGSLLLTYAFRRVFRGFLGAEFLKMLQVRFGRSLAYLIAIVSLVTGLFYIPFQYYTVGDFEVRPSDCVDIPVPMDCFISGVLVEDGQLVKQGAILVELRAPDLLSQLETKQAELRESEANLMRLKAGPRPEEIADQESRVQRLSSWCKLGRLEVETTQNALTHQLEALEHRIEQARTELVHAEKAIQLSERLADQGALAEAQLERERTRLKILRERVSEVESERSVRATEGIRLAIAELSRREQELADAEGKLSLLRLGSRPEEIAAEEARRQRLVEELEFLNEQKTRLSVVAPTDGYVSAVRLREKVGSYSAKGTLLCQIERPGQRRVEVFVPEDDAMTVQPGQPVTLKARALPLASFHGEVERIAPSANKPGQAIAAKQLAPQQTVVVHCRVDAASGQLKSGMTGFARVFRGWSTLGEVLQLKAYKYLRTEFWW